MHRVDRCSLAFRMSIVAIGAGMAAVAVADAATVSGRVRVESALRFTAPPSSDPADKSTLAAAAAWVPLFVALPPGERAVAVTAHVVGGGVAAAELDGDAALCGYNLARVRVARAAVDAAAAMGSAEVRIEVTSAAGAPVALQRLRPDPDREARDRAAVARLVCNPGDVARFAPTVIARPVHSGGAAKVAPGFRPSGDPSLDGSGVRYLIVTTEALAGAFQPLVDWKTRRGVPTAIRTIEWIESRTRRGVDRAETLRNFLVEAYTLWGIEYVLLGGDSELLPSRMAYSAIYGGGTAPADLYFACLDGTWNADGDAIWGEGATSPGVGESDLLPEIAVGRAPVNDETQTQVFVNRVIDYETPLFADYQHRAAFLAEVLIPANWDSGETISYNGAPGTEQMLTQSIPATFDIERLYDTWWSYPGSQRLTRVASLAAMNSGVGIVNHLGHGFRYTMSCGDGSLVNSDADALVNGGRTFFLCMANCAAVAFDYNCLAERFLLNPGGGAAGVLGASRSVSASLIVTYNRALHHQLFELNQVHAGTLLNALRLERVGFAELDGSDRWIQFSLVLLGDPEMPIFTAAVQTGDIAVADSLPVGPDTLAVTVTAGGSPIAGAAVCAFKPDDVYAVATTNSSGVAHLDIAPRTPGALAITVSGSNLAVDTTTVWVTPVPSPVVVLAGHTLDDDAIAPSQGNGNGGADAGEIVELWLDVRNAGPSAAKEVTAVIGPDGPGYSVLADSVAVGGIDAETTIAAASAAVVSIEAGVADGTVLEIPVVFFDGEGRSWNERVRVLVCAPKPVVARVDAVTAPGAPLALACVVKNLGSGVLEGLSATFTPDDTLLAVTPQAVFWDDLAPLASSSAGTTFAVGDSTTASAPGTLEFIDAAGRQFTLHVDAVPPAPPELPEADLSWGTGTVRVTWTPSSAPDRLGYHVFRSHAGGTFERITADVIVHSDFYDRDVTPNTHYEYYTVAVDQSRQWSAPSPIRAVDTIAAAVSGWPVELAEPTASSVAVGDLDGDGGVEVVVGDNGVYAWRANGSEVLDGDNDATTDGVFSALPGTLNASVALADLDGLPGLEIVGASWLTNKIYAWNAAGDLLPGWPREPLRGGNTGYWASPAIGEIDGQAPPEIVAISKDGNLYAWHADGTAVFAEPDGFVRAVGAWTQATPALADLDRDGRCEIITSGSSARVDVTRPDGSDYPGWPYTLFALSKGSPAVGDVDGDGDHEIVITSESDHLYVFNDDGTFLPGWPRLLAADSPDLGPSPALGDLDGDGRLEIVVCAVKGPGPFLMTKLYVLDADGDVMLEKPLGTNAQSSPILADVDGDGTIDIVHGGEAGVLHAWNLTGNELNGFPIPLGDYIRGTPQYCDLDADGYGDLVLAGWNRTVYAWRMAGVYRRDRAPWPTFHGDIARSGLLPSQFPTAIEDVPPPARLASTWSPNPFNPSISVRLAIPGTQAVAVRVDVFDARGRRVRRLVDEVLSPGTAVRTWNGRSDADQVLPSGIYLYRVEAAGQVTRGKLTLVR